MRNFYFLPVLLALGCNNVTSPPVIIQQSPPSSDKTVIIDRTTTTVPVPVPVQTGPRIGIGIGVGHCTSTHFCGKCDVCNRNGWGRPGVGVNININKR